VDLYTDSDEVSKGHTVLTFDIEVEAEHGLPNIELADNEIISVAGHDSVTNEYFAMILDREGKMTEGEINGTSIEVFDSEYDLLNAFVLRWEQINPTIVTGWAIDHFDIPYTYRRIQRVLGNEAARRLSPIGNVYYNKYRRRFFLAGVSCLDYLQMYKKFTYTDEPTYRLDAIAKKELGKGKEEYEGTLDDLYNTDRNQFMRYNIKDVQLVVELDRKLKLIELVQGICHVGHVPYEDYMYSSKFLEGAILTWLRKKNLVAPNKPVRTGAEFNEGDKFTGAYVKQPTPGKYDWVYDLDLTSLYPSIIMSLNISPEVKIGKVLNFSGDKFLNEPESTCRVKILNVGTEEITYKKLRNILVKNNIGISANGVLYKLPKRKLVGKIIQNE